MQCCPQAVQFQSCLQCSCLPRNIDKISTSDSHDMAKYKASSLNQYAVRVLKISMLPTQRDDDRLHAVHNLVEIRKCK